MRRFTVAVVLLATATIALAPARHAEATYFGIHGVACVPDTGQVSDFLYNTEGIASKATGGSRSVICPITIPSSFAGTELRVTAHDPYSSSAIVCQTYAYNSSGTEYVSALRYTSGSFGQYSSATNSYTGHSYIYWASDAGFNNLSDTVALAIKCTLPAYSGSGLGPRIISAGAYTSSP